jgi:hypothetical protein
MHKLQQIDDKIIRLKKLKGDIEIRLGRELYRKIHAILGEDFSPQLVLAIMSETWKSATLKQKETWRSQADSFPFFGRPGIFQKNSETTHPSS